MTPASRLHDVVATGAGGRVPPHHLLGRLLQDALDLLLGALDAQLGGPLDEQEQLALPRRRRHSGAEILPARGDGGARDLRDLQQRVLVCHLPARVLREVVDLQLRLVVLAAAAAGVAVLRAQLRGKGGRARRLRGLRRLRGHPHLVGNLRRHSLRRRHERVVRRGARPWLRNRQRLLLARAGRELDPAGLAGGVGLRRDLRRHLLCRQHVCADAARLCRAVRGDDGPGRGRPHRLPWLRLPWLRRRRLWLGPRARDADLRAVIVFLLAVIPVIVVGIRVVLVVLRAERLALLVALRLLRRVKLEAAAAVAAAVRLGQARLALLGERVAHGLQVTGDGLLALPERFDDIRRVFVVVGTKEGDGGALGARAASAAHAVHVVLVVVGRVVV
mmetsp:Transcript_11757/g.29758  ORF Transcript_11757/g.29758 Transcript_11757/m.29758 type:complete len:389 (+) Transcript_11757:227-1393(+)